MYGSARPFYLKILDSIHNHALRLCLRVFGTSPAVTLCIQVSEPLLTLRRKKLALQYCLKLSANTNNRTYNAVFNSKFKTHLLCNEQLARPKTKEVRGLNLKQFKEFKQKLPKRK